MQILQTRSVRWRTISYIVHVANIRKDPGSIPGDARSMANPFLLFAVLGNIVVSM